MNVEIKNLDQTNRQMTITIDKGAYEKDYEKALNKFAKQVQLDGFRKGKAPISAVKRLYQGQIFEYYIEENLNDYYREALDTSKANPISQGKFIDTQSNDAGEILFVFEFECFPEEFEYEYKNLTVEFKDEKYEDKYLEDTIKSILEENAEEIPFDEKQTVEMGDKLTINDLDDVDNTIPVFTLSKEELKRVLATDENPVLGLKINDKFVCNGHNYQIADAFKMNVPKLNEETAKILGHENVKAMKKSIKENLVKEIEQRNNHGLKFAIVEAFGMKNKENIQIPKEYLLRAGRSIFRQYLGNQLNEDMLDKMGEELLLEVAERQRPNIIWDIAFEKIAKDHNIEITEDEINAEIIKYAEQFNISADDFKEKYTNSLDTLKDDILSSKVVEFIKPFCVITEPAKGKEKTDENNVENAEYEVVEEKKKTRKKKGE